MSSAASSVFERVLYVVLSDEEEGGRAAHEETTAAKFRFNVDKWEAGAGVKVWLNRQTAHRRAWRGNPKKGEGGGAWGKKQSRPETRICHEARPPRQRPLTPHFYSP